MKGRGKNRHGSPERQKRPQSLGGRSEGGSWRDLLRRDFGCSERGERGLLKDRLKLIVDPGSDNHHPLEERGMTRSEGGGTTGEGRK